MQRYEPTGPTDPPPTTSARPSSSYKPKKNGSKNNSEIVIDPDRHNKSPDDIREEKDGSHAMMIGGFSPFTIGHHEVAKQMQKAGHDSVNIFTTTSKRRPISPENKVNYIKKAVGKSANVGTAQTPLHAAAQMYAAGRRGHLTFYGGSDRAGIVDKLKQYNGKKSAHGHYDFKSISFKQVGAERKEGSKGIAGVSGSLARKSSSPEELKKYIPKSLHPHAEAIYKDLKEELIVEGQVASIRTRLRRALTAKRDKAKLALARKLASKRLAKAPQLKRRAQKIARKLMRIRSSGSRGAAYNKLSMSDKIALDNMIKDKSPVIQRIAKRILPKVKSRDVQRLTGKQLSTIPMMNSYVDHYKNIIQECGLEENFIDSVMAKILAEKQDITPTSLRAYRERNSKEKEKLGIPIRQQVKEEEIDEKDLNALHEKANQSGVSFDTLKTVFNRGMRVARAFKPRGSTEQQSAFARVNSFINKGKSYKELDKDLAMMHRNNQQIQKKVIDP